MVNATVRRFDFSLKHEQWQIYNFTLKLQCAVHYSWLINTFVPGHSQSNYFHKEWIINAQHIDTLIFT